MKNKIILVSLLLFLSSNKAVSCEYETIFKGTFELNTIYDKKLKHEKSFINKLDKNSNSIVGEIIPIKRSHWNVKNINNDVIGRIDGNLIFLNEKSSCESKKIKFEHRTNKKYFVTKNGIYIGEIYGRLPRI